MVVHVWLLMHYPVVEFRKFCRIPAVSGSYKVSGDALQTVYVITVAFGAFGELGRGILVAA